MSVTLKLLLEIVESGLIAFLNSLKGAIWKKSLGNPALNGPEN